MLGVTVNTPGCWVSLWSPQGAGCHCEHSRVLGDTVGTSGCCPISQPILAAPPAPSMPCQLILPPALRAGDAGASSEVFALQLQGLDRFCAAQPSLAQGCPSPQSPHSTDHGTAPQTLHLCSAPEAGILAAGPGAGIWKP